MIGLFFIGVGMTLIIGVIAWYVVNRFVIGKDED